MNYFSKSTESSYGYTSWHKDVILQALYSTLQQPTNSKHMTVTPFVVSLFSNLVLVGLLKVRNVSVE